MEFRRIFGHPGVAITHQPARTVGMQLQWNLESVYSTIRDGLDGGVSGSGQDGLDGELNKEAQEVLIMIASLNISFTGKPHHIAQIPTRSGRPDDQNIPTTALYKVIERD